MANVTVTLLRRKGERVGNNFVGTTEVPGEWSILAQNEDLKAQGVNFVTIEYDNLRSLDGSFGKRVNRSPYIEFRINGDPITSEAYPQGKPLTAINLSSFALDFRKRRSGKSEAVITGTEMVKRVDASTGSTETPVDTGRSWKTPLIVAGSILGVAGILFTGFLLWDWRKKNTVNMAEPLFMMDGEEDQPIDFSRVNFGEKSL